MKEFPNRLPNDPDAGIDQDPTDLKYEWSNVRILVNAAQIGVQMTGDWGEPARITFRSSRLVDRAPNGRTLLPVVRRDNRTNVRRLVVPDQ